MKQALVDNGFRMRWTYAIVFKNTGSMPFDFELAEIGSRAGGPSDDIMGGMAQEAFVHRLAFFGRDGAGGGVRRPIAIRFDSSVGARQ